MAALPFTLHVYRTAMSALSPLAPFVLRSRALRGKEETARLGERLGQASLPRPSGQLVWIHGASVGECVAALPLVQRLLETSGRSVLVTSGTVTSAHLMAKRLPPGALHQYAPVDLPGAVRKFLDHWRPDAALFVDSEIWPNMLAASHARGIALALVNGRISKRSFRGWQRAPRTAAGVLSFFRNCLAQDDETAERLIALGARNVTVSGNLKADALPPPVDASEYQALSDALRSRPLLLAASTHTGEEEILLPAHDQLRRFHPDLVTIVVPRHPDRGGHIAMLCGSRKVLRRSERRLPERDTAIYVADTMGELGLFYRLASFAFMGGSLVPHGGQNPLEATLLGRAVMAGSYTDNFARAYETIFAAQGCGRVRTSSEIVAFGQRLLTYPSEASRLGAAAAGAAKSLGGALEKTLNAVEAMLADANA